MALAVSLLADPVLDTLITGESAFDTLPEVMARLAAAPGDTLCHRITLRVGGRSEGGTDERYEAQAQERPISKPPYLRTLLTS